LIALSGLDLAGQSGLLVYRRRAKETTSLLEQPLIHPVTEEATQMEENDENRPLKDFAAPKAIGIQLDYTVPNVAANNFELKSALLNMLSQHMFNGLAHEDPRPLMKNCVTRLKLMVLNPRPLNLEHFLFL
jgi:hypothetical protein